MKTFSLILVLLSSLIFGSCKKEKSQKMNVYIHCSGYFLKIGNDDYQVCNEDKVSIYENNMEVSVKFKRIDKCKITFTNPRCAAINNNNRGWIEVTEIEKE